MKFNEKLKFLRKKLNMTQADFANSIGISRGNLANIETGKVKPTPIFINCISLMYHIDKEWLIDDNNDDLSILENSSYILSLIMSKYEQLDDKYKKFIEDQITYLLELQNQEKK